MILFGPILPKAALLLFLIREIMRKQCVLSVCSLIILLQLLFFSGCGLEDFYFLYPVEEENIVPISESRATVRIDQRNQSVPNFLNYVIFYRIYVSDSLQISIEPGIFNLINPALNTNHNTLSPYIGSTTFGNTNLDNVFRNIRFNYLELENNQIANVLSSSVFNETLIFDFSHGGRPIMIVNGVEYTLFRSTGGGTFNPMPDDDSLYRYFVNSAELRRRENINDNINADVSDLTRSNSLVDENTILYTYAALYIAAVGLNPVTYTSFYSTPSLIHVFLLPDL